MSRKPGEMEFLLQNSLTLRIHDGPHSGTLYFDTKNEGNFPRARGVVKGWRRSGRPPSNIWNNRNKWFSMKAQLRFASVVLDGVLKHT